MIDINNHSIEIKFLDTYSHKTINSTEALNSLFYEIIEHKNIDFIPFFLKKYKREAYCELETYLSIIEIKFPDYFWLLLEFILSFYAENSPIYSSSFYAFLIKFLNNNKISSIKQYKILDSYFKKALIYDGYFVNNIALSLQDKDLFSSEENTLIILNYIFKKYPNLFIIFFNSYNNNYDFSQFQNFKFVIKSDIVKKHILKNADKYSEHKDINLLRTQYLINGF